MRDGLSYTAPRSIPKPAPRRPVRAVRTRGVTLLGLLAGAVAGAFFLSLFTCWILMLLLGDLALAGFHVPLLGFWSCYWIAFLITILTGTKASATAS